MSNRAILVGFLIMPAIAYASSVDPQLDSARFMLAQQEYGRALSIVRRTLQLQPTNFDARYLLFAAIQTRILDYESYAVESDDFLRLADSLIRVAQPELPYQHGLDSVRCLFYIGSYYGGKSLIEAKVNNWLAAAKDGIASVSMLDIVKKRLPSWYPAYLGTGAFNYYFNQNFAWIPLGRSRQEQALKDVWIATSAPFPFDLAAKNSLCWILIDRGELAKADSLAQTALAHFPSNTIFLRIRAQTALQSAAWAQARQFACLLIDRSRSRIPVNWSDLVSGYHTLLRSLHQTRDRQQILAVSSEALGLSIPDASFKISYVRKHLDGIRSIRQKCMAGGAK